MKDYYQVLAYSFAKDGTGTPFRFVKESNLTGDFVMHTHDFFEIEIVVSGEAETVLNGECITLRRGKAEIISPTDVHNFCIKQPMDFYKIMIKPEWLLDETIGYLMEHLGVVEFSEDELKDLIPLLELLMKEGQNPTPENRAFLGNLMGCILYFFGRNRSNRAASSKIYTPNRRLNTALNYILLNYTKKISLAEVAQEVHLSPVYFSTMFHRTVGETFVAYVNNLRLNRAKQLLLYSNLSVSEICYGCGFDSTSNFSKTFKTKFGCSPSDMKSRK